jgi:hypothetical protein
MSSEEVKNPYQNSIQFVAKFQGNDGLMYIDHDTWFYNILDYYNGENVNRYGCLRDESIVDIVQLTFDEWKRLTPRQEYSTMTFEEFLHVLRT